MGTLGYPFTEEELQEISRYAMAVGKTTEEVLEEIDQKTKSVLERRTNPRGPIRDLESRKQMEMFF